MISTSRPSIAFALPGQLRDLLEQHLDTPHRRYVLGVSGCGRRHITIIAEGYDTF